MSEQIGIIPLKGTMNNMTFYKSKDGIRVKMQSKISKEKILSSDSFERTRENLSEFGRAGAAGRLLRNGLRSIIKLNKDPRVVSRLLKVTLAAIKADATNPRGKRNITDGEVEKLRDFDFNRNASLKTILPADYTTGIDRVTGKLTISIPGFNPANELTKPQDATHYRVLSAGMEVDFENNKENTVVFESDILPISNIDTADMQIEHQLTVNSEHPLFLFLGVQFFLDTNGVQYPMKSIDFNALSIVDVEGV